MRSTVACCIAFLVLGSLTGCREEPLLQIPEELIGRWESENERYAGRFFEITSAYIAFGMGDGYVQYYTHKSIEQDYISGATVYRMEYVRRPGARPLQFTFSWSRGTIRPINQPTVAWKKVPR